MAVLDALHCVALAIFCLRSNTVSQNMIQILNIWSSMESVDVLGSRTNLWHLVLLFGSMTAGWIGLGGWWWVELTSRVLPKEEKSGRLYNLATPWKPQTRPRTGYTTSSNYLCWITCLLFVLQMAYASRYVALGCFTVTLAQRKSEYLTMTHIRVNSLHAKMAIMGE
jgi:hypothetical protein